MIRGILIGVAAFVLVVVSVSIFLSPNDLVDCETKPNDKTGCEKADAIVAVSGGYTLARTKSAIELYKNGWADLVIFSGAAADPDSPSNAAVMKEEAIAAGIPSDAILVEEHSKNTQENAVNTEELIEKYDIDSVILTTSPYHQRRASLEFEKVTSSTVKVRSKPADDSSWSLWWLKPTGWWLAISEIIGIAGLNFRSAS